MQLIYFETTRNSHDKDDVHALCVAEMRALAESVDGFALWRDRDEGLNYWGVVMFESEEAAMRWKTHPDHARIHNLSEDGLYQSFKTMAFDSVRQNAFSAEGA